MLISEVKELLSVELRGDNASFELTPTLLKMALFDVLRRTKPRTHIVRDDYRYYRFEHFRQIAKSYYLRKPVVDISDNAKLDMEDELCMAVVYFLASYLSQNNKSVFKSQAQEIIDYYDTNVVFKYEWRYLNLYEIQGLELEHLREPSCGGSSGYTPPNTPPKVELKPILKGLAIEVGRSATVLVDNSGGAYEVKSDTNLLKTELSGNVLTITSLGEMEKGVVTVKNNEFIYTIEVFSASSDGGIIN